jgi:hypothetical protein
MTYPYDPKPETEEEQLQGTECDTCVDRALTVKDGAKLRRCDSCEDGSEWRPELAPEPAVKACAGYRLTNDRWEAKSPDPHITPHVHEPEERAPAPDPVPSGVSLAALESAVVDAAIDAVRASERYTAAIASNVRVPEYLTTARMALAETEARAAAVEAEIELAVAVGELLDARGGYPATSTVRAPWVADRLSHLLGVLESGDLAAAKAECRRSLAEVQP